jgi:hypothetical protein
MTFIDWKRRFLNVSGALELPEASPGLPAASGRRWRGRCESAAADSRRDLKRQLDLSFLSL